jgi:HPt (histidine-containing phosphotransfer) domain-containing protein
MADLSKQPALLDHDYLRVNFHEAGFRYLLPEILLLFQGQLAICQQSFEQLLTKGDLQGLAVEAHTLKGSAGSVGADALAQAAKHIEEQAPFGTQENAAMLVKQLKQLAELTEGAITAELERLTREEDSFLDLL